MMFLHQFDILTLPRSTLRNKIQRETSKDSHDLVWLPLEETRRLYNQTAGGLWFKCYCTVINLRPGLRVLYSFRLIQALPLGILRFCELDSFHLNSACNSPCQSAHLHMGQKQRSAIFPRLWWTWSDFLLISWVIRRTEVHMVNLIAAKNLCWQPASSRRWIIVILAKQESRVHIRLLFRNVGTLDTVLKKISTGFQTSTSQRSPDSLPQGAQWEPRFLFFFKHPGTWLQRELKVTLTQPSYRKWPKPKNIKNRHSSWNDIWFICLCIFSHSLYISEHCLLFLKFG